jgi:hypothetical protein
MGARVLSFAFLELERDAMVARSVATVGSVTIYGVAELECAKSERPSFIEAWRNAICFEIGSEEFEKICGEGRKR